MTIPDLVALVGGALSRVAEALPVLLGGAGGVVFVWWLDGRRERRRQVASLRGAVVVVTIEMSGNISHADLWASLAERRSAGEPDELLTAAPIQMRFEAWDRNQNELARSLPRGDFLQVAAAYELGRLFTRNIEVSRSRRVIEMNDVSVATRVRDTFQAALRVVQTFEQRKLGVPFETEPIGPAEERATRQA